MGDWQPQRFWGTVRSVAGGGPCTARTGGHRGRGGGTSLSQSEVACQADIIVLFRAFFVTQSI